VTLVDFSLGCSQCNTELVQATITLSVDIDEPFEKDILFNTVYLMCRNCLSELDVVQDELTRDIQAYFGTI